MKNIKIKLMAVGFLALVSPSIVSAHESGGSLGVAASATDVYQVGCNTSDGQPYKLFFDITNATPSSSPLSAQVINGDVAMSTTDHSGGDTISSPKIEVVRPSGTTGAMAYTIVVDKSGAGAVNYGLEFHCEDINGQHTGTDDILPVQNQ